MKKNSKRQKKEADDSDGEYTFNLESIKKDPEFYEFLAQNDKSLLEFNEDEFSESESEHEDMSEDELEEEEEDADMPEKEHEDVLEVIRAVKKGIQANQYKSLQRFLSHLKGTLAEDESVKLTNEELFAEIMEVAVRDVPAMLNATKMKKPLVKTWLKNLLTLSEQITDDASMDYILFNLSQASFGNYLAAFQASAVTKAWIKFLVGRWSKLPKASDEEEGSEPTDIQSVNVNAFMLLKQVVYKDDWLMKRSLKAAYKAFLQRSKRTNQSFLKHLQFLANSLVELFKVDQHEAYQHAFISIRHVAINARKALTTHRSADALQGLLAWETVNRLCFWCKCIGDVSKEMPLMLKLIFPLVQTSNAILSLAKGAQWFPLQLHLVNALTVMSAKTKKFVPVSSFIFAALKEIARHQKIKPSTLKPLTWETSIRASQQYLHTRVFLDDAQEKFFNVLLKFLASWSYSIAFPEMSVSVLVQLRMIVKSSKNPKLSEMAKALIDKINESAEQVRKGRKSVQYAPRHLAEVMKFNNKDNALIGHSKNVEQMEYRKRNM